MSHQSRTRRGQECLCLLALLTGMGSAQGQPDPAPVVRLELGQIAAAPGQSNVVVPLLASVDGGIIRGWSAVAHYDPAILVFSSATAAAGADVFTVIEPRKLVAGTAGPGQVSLAAIYGLLDGRGIAPEAAQVVASLTFCVLPGAAQGMHAVTFLPSAVSREGAVTTTMAVVAPPDWAEVETVPRTTDGAVTVAGDTLPGSTCVPYDFSPPPPPRVAFRLEGPTSVTLGQAFSLDFKVESEVAVDALNAALVFDSSKLAGLAGAAQEAALGVGPIFDIVSVQDGTIGIVLLLISGSLPPGTHTVARLEFLAQGLPTAGTTEVAFTETVQQLINPADFGFTAEQAGLVPFTFSNIVNPTAGDDLLSPVQGGTKVGVLAAHLLAIRPAARFVRGDSDADAKVSLTDAVTVLSHLFAGGAEPGCLDAGDANDDGRLDISDPIAVLGYLFLGSPSLPAPFGACGEDATEDSLGCEVYAACP
ncbi:MAG: hypothetical protein HY721_03940 [Planctomycetes bacterium]|nr:hypothetical protein [Planctomycetota bacterium]